MSSIYSYYKILAIFPVLYNISLYFFFFIYNLFYWSIADFQCCVNFCYTAKWFSYINIYPFPYSFSLWLITGYSIQFPVLIQSVLVVYFVAYFIPNGLYLFLPTPLLPPSLSPLVITSLFSRSPSLLQYSH